MQASKNPPKNCYRNTEPNLYGVYPAAGGGPSQHKGVLACLVLSCVKHALEFHIQDCSTCVLSRVVTLRHLSRCVIVGPWSGISQTPESAVIVLDINVCS